MVDGGAKPWFGKRLLRWLKRQVIGEVPEEIAVCEYDCRKGQCTMGDWEKCDRRVDKAADELMPRR